jgi:mRNA-degrading endonuclease toxin of MazEF toxin-antitoxin module
LFGGILVLESRIPADDSASRAETIPKPSRVKISQTRTVSFDRLGKKIATVDPKMMAQLVDGPRHSNPATDRRQYAA